MQEALQIIKQELGPDAIILSTRNNKKGFGLLSKASVEVTAAVSERAMLKKKVTEKVVSDERREIIKNLPASRQAQVIDDVGGHYVQKAEAIVAAKKAAAQPAPAGRGRYIDIQDEDDGASAALIGGGTAAPSQGYARSGRLARAAAEEAVESQQHYIAAPAPAQMSQGIGAQSAGQPRFTAPAEDVGQLKDDVKRLKLMIEELKAETSSVTDGRIVEGSSTEISEEFHSLLRNGVDRKYAAALMKQVTFNIPREAMNAPDRITEGAAAEMMENIRVENLLDFQPGGDQRIIAFVGPTGVGKTTTIAKIASQAMLGKNLRVGLINLDAYRVGAADQLATYSKILGVPFRHATSEAELERALAEFKPLDLVLIDTTGRSQKDNDGMASTKNLLSTLKGLRTVLIMSATTRDTELYDIITRYRMYGPSHLVFSKLDVASIYGCIYNVAVKTGIPIAYFTVGQRVPEDIEPATKERVVDLILDL